MAGVFRFAPVVGRIERGQRPVVISAMNYSEAPKKTTPFPCGFALTLACR